jgi:hypothetical protein
VPNDLDVLVLKGMIRLLEPIERVSVLSQGAKYLMLPYVHRVVVDLLDELREVNVMDIGPLRAFKHTLINSLESRFEQFNDPVHPCRLAALMSPCNFELYSSDDWKSETKKSTARLAEWLVYIQAGDKMDDVEKEGDESNARRGKAAGMVESDSSDDGAARRASVEAARESALKEAKLNILSLMTHMEEFVTENEASCSFTPESPHTMDAAMGLFFRSEKNSSSEGSKLSVLLMLLVLSAAASSASSERVFSATGLLDSPLRNRLSAEALEAMTVVKVFFSRSTKGEQEEFWEYSQRCFGSPEDCSRLRRILVDQYVQAE